MPPISNMVRSGWTSLKSSEPLVRVASSLRSFKPAYDRALLTSIAVTRRPGVKGYGIGMGLGAVAGGVYGAMTAPDDGRSHYARIAGGALAGVGLGAVGTTGWGAYRSPMFRRSMRDLTRYGGSVARDVTGRADRWAGSTYARFRRPGYAAGYFTGERGAALSSRLNQRSWQTAMRAEDPGISSRFMGEYY